MKKKKPKKSSAKKSPPKGASSAKESPTTSLSNKALSDSSDVKDDSSLYSKVASDAQIGLFAEEVSQQSREAPDLSDIPTGSTSSKIEIVVVSADPSSLNLADLDLVPQTVAGSDDSILRSTDLSPDVKATSSPAVSQAGLLVLASADANVSLSLQIAEKTVSNVVPDPATDTDKNTSLVKQAAQLKSQSNSGTEENSSNHLEKPLTAHIEATKTNPDPTETWCTHAKGYGKPLKKQGGVFVLPSGEASIKISNSVIEKNIKSWKPFVLGQFYSHPPSQGILHNIVNGIWSKNYRDIAVSKMEGFSFLFRIPNVATRNRVIKQRLWQIEGQTMFVDKWEPGIVPVKPELTSAPIWLELRKVPSQLFNEDGLERIAGLVRHPKFLHPMTANKTNMEVAKVFTIIDPRKPFPEAVNV
ncbi:unnamed protein product [Brassica oleracea]